MTTILAIDWGKKRLGIARASSEAKIATPLTTTPNQEDVFEQIRRITREENADTIVVGLPRNMSGEETHQSREVREFVAALENALQCSVVLQDETLTSYYITDMQKQYPEADKDSLAATQILKDYLQTT